MQKKWISLMAIFLVFPASGTYKLDGFTFGGGGQMVGSSNYNANAVVGEAAAQNLSGGSFDLGAGLVFTNQAHVPQAPTLDNTGNYYNKLHFSINNVSQSGATFPSDTKFAVAISNDNFVTTQYVKSDNTIGGTLSLGDYQTYTTWSASGGFVTGLDVGTTYSIKVKAIQASFNESGWGPVSTSGTVNPSFTFAINVGAGYTQAPPPYLIDMGDLINGSIVTSSKRVWVDIDTNASSGGNVYVTGQNGGLYSPLSGYTISSVSTDLGATSVGFGIQGVGATQTSGGPLNLVAPYTATGNSVGQVSKVLSGIFSSGLPVYGGQGSFVIKAKSANDTPEGSDYNEVLTVIGAANY